MGNKIFEIFGVVTIEDKKVNTSLNNIDKKAKSVASNMQKSFDKLNSSLGGIFQKSIPKINIFKKSGESAANSLSNKFSSLARIITAAFSVRAIKNMTQSLIEATATLRALDEQFAQIFKGNETAGALEAIKKQSIETGIHVDRLKTSWASFGAMAKGAGMVGVDALNMTSRATKIAADAAAFYDIKLEESSSLLQSYMLGNFRAGRSIGIFTNATMMESKAIAAYGKSWKDLDSTQRQLILMKFAEKTYNLNGAVGQAAREADNWENALGNVTAAFKRLLFTLGSPILRAVVNITKELSAGFVRIQEKLEAMDWKNVTIGISAFKKLNDAFFNLVEYALDNYKAISDFFKKSFSGVGKSVKMMQSIFRDSIGEIIYIFKTLFNTALFAFNGIVGLVGSNFIQIKNIIVRVLGIASRTVTLFSDLVSRVFSNSIGIVRKSTKGVLDAISSILGYIESNWVKVEAIIAPLALIISNVITKTVLGIKKIWPSLLNLATSVKTLFMQIIDGVYGFVRDNFDNIVNLVDTVIKGIDKAFKFLSGFIKKHGNAIKETFSELLKAAPSILSSIISSFTIFGKVIEALTPLILTLVNIFAKLSPALVFIGTSFALAGGFMNSVFGKAIMFVIGKLGRLILTAGNFGPIINQMGTYIYQFALKVGGIGPAAQKFASGIAGISSKVSGFGLDITGSTLKVKSFFASLSATKAGGAIAAIGGKIGAVFSGIGTAVSGAATAVAAFFGISVGWLVAIVVAITAAVVLIVKNWDKVKESFVALWELIKIVGKKIGEAILAPFKWAIDGVMKLVNKVKGFWSKLFPEDKKEIDIEANMDINDQDIKMNAPEMAVKWNAKGGIMERPTIFGAASGKFLGGGEAGREGILPLEGPNMNTWIDPLADRLSKKTEASEKIENHFHINGITIREEADIHKISKELNKLQNQTNRARGRV